MKTRPPQQPPKTDQKSDQHIYGKLEVNYLARALSPLPRKGTTHNRVGPNLLVFSGAAGNAVGGPQEIENPSQCPPPESTRKRPPEMGYNLRFCTGPGRKGVFGGGGSFQNFTAVQPTVPPPSRCLLGRVLRPSDAPRNFAALGRLRARRAFMLAEALGLSWRRGALEVGWCGDSLPIGGLLVLVSSYLSVAKCHWPPDPENPEV